MNSSTIQYLCLFSVLSLLSLSPHRGNTSVPELPAHIHQLYRVPAHEGIFAYGRISPDGRHLAFTAQRYDADHARASRIQRVVDVRTGDILFNEPGFDGYWSPDGRRLIFMSTRGERDSVSILNMSSGRVVRDVAPPDLGDYPSWAVRDGRDLIVTILNNYYYLNGDRATFPVFRIELCEGIGKGERPLVSKQGRRISTFVGGELVVRDLDDCHDTVTTHIAGGKADFSYDGRYLAFHAEKRNGIGYEVRIVDLARRSIASLTPLPGSCLYPNWTRDGRLVFRYDSADFRGFVVAAGVLGHRFEPLPTRGTVGRSVERATRWEDVFVEQRRAEGRLTVVLIWAPWNPHSIEAIESLSQAFRVWRGQRADVSAFAAVEPSSWPLDSVRMKAATRFALPEVQMRSDGIAAAGVVNQIPTFLAFLDDSLIDSLLGAQAPATLVAWRERLMFRVVRLQTGESLPPPRVQ